ncbi:PREDICTED: uncharacterized protein LOC108358372 [Rhagoletis zephyria]|uniref:uncharacterized protein LOC108358372 n=1 Tax=Rhagoletis zephyria TaxID=28612 RepID=UPI00081164BC|nr:PREDICTED: uncharacterized protein LOC108358372 [Rhagoletis zephyria]
MGSFGSTKKIRAELWKKFATELNAIGPPIRSGREWNKVWLDYKLKLKKKLPQNRRENVATGGGPYTQQSLTPLERTVDELLHLQEAVNPTGSSFGTNVAETTVSANELDAEVPLGEQALQVDFAPGPSTPRKTYELKKEELNLLKLKEERKTT